MSRRHPLQKQTYWCGCRTPSPTETNILRMSRTPSLQKTYWCGMSRTPSPQKNILAGRRGRHLQFVSQGHPLQKKHITRDVEDAIPYRKTYWCGMSRTPSHTEKDIGAMSRTPSLQFASQGRRPYRKRWCGCRGRRPLQKTYGCGMSRTPSLQKTCRCGMSRTPSPTEKRRGTGFEDAVPYRKTNSAGCQDAILYILLFCVTS